MNKGELRHLLKRLDPYIGYIYDNHESFLDCHAGVDDWSDLIEVWFSESHIKYVYLVESGATVCNSITIDEFCEWAISE